MISKMPNRAYAADEVRGSQSVIWRNANKRNQCTCFKWKIAILPPVPPNFQWCQNGGNQLALALIIEIFFLLREFHVY